MKYKVTVRGMLGDSVYRFNTFKDLEIWFKKEKKYEDSK